MYQDDIMAMMGGPKTLEEQRMADALRSQRTGGDLLGLSTIGQVSQLGQNMSQRATAGAKQMGTLAQAREQAAAQRLQQQETAAARVEAAQVSEAANQTRHAEGMALKKAIEYRQVLDDKNTLINKEKDRDFRILKLNNETEGRDAKLGFNVSRFLSKYDLARDEFEYRKDIGTARLEQRNVEIEDNFNMGISRLNLDQAKLDTMKNQFGVREGNIMSRHQADSILKWVKFDWDKDKFGMKRSDDQLRRLRGEYEFDVNLAQERAELNSSLGFAPGTLDAEMELEANDKEIAENKLAFSLVGRTVPRRDKMLKGSEDKYDEISKEAASFFGIMSDYKPKYASQTPFSGTAQNLISPLAPILPDDINELNSWWTLYEKYNVLEERHKMFGAVLTDAEIVRWNMANISRDDPDDVIRRNLAWREAFMRDKIQRQAGNALEMGASPNYVMRNFGSYIGGDNVIQVAEGDPFNSTENNVVLETSTPTGMEDMTDEQLQKIARGKVPD
tara:strand:- start:38 stop:1546 length:1509 start_codon:yes stop_codon:yes gene_type:complete